MKFVKMTPPYCKLQEDGETASMCALHIYQYVTCVYIEGGCGSGKNCREHHESMKECVKSWD